MTESTSRLEPVRNRLRTLRRVLAAAAVVVFAGFLALARASHPGASGSAPGGTGGGAIQPADLGQSEDFGFDGGSVGPSSDAPAVQSSGS